MNYEKAKTKTARCGEKKCFTRKDWRNIDMPWEKCMPRDSNTKRWLKKQSRRAVRKWKRDLGEGNDYRKIIDLKWTLL